MAKESETSSRFKSQFIMTNEILTFTSDVFGEIRTCQVNNQIMFVGKDVAQALGYSNTRDALSKHVDAEDKGTVAIRDTAYETRVTLINESGLYSLILSSKLPQAKAFKRWVTSEVLPQIRQTGGYIPTKDAQGRQLSNEEIINRADAIVCRTLCMLNADAEDTLTATQVAKTFNMTVTLKSLQHHSSKASILETRPQFCLRKPNWLSLSKSFRQAL